MTRMNPGNKHQETREYLGCGYDWLMREARENRIPHYHIGNKIFFIRENLDEFILEQIRLSSVNSEEHCGTPSKIRRIGG